MTKKIFSIFKENRLLKFMLFYGIFYLLGFFWLESREVELNMVYSKWDSVIPFCEYFVIPYFSWFVYIAITLIYFLFYCKDYQESKKFVVSFCVGMSIFLLVSYIYPNGHNLRPELTGDSIFIKIMRFLHWIDTPTNVLPSMHVYVTVACSAALLRQEFLHGRKGIKMCIGVWSILIILSTLFLKQHSVVDVICALLLNGLCYVGIYKLADGGRRKIAGLWKKQFT